MINRGAGVRVDSDCKWAIARFNEADKVYQAALEGEKEVHYARRHSALMLILSSQPHSHAEICVVMRIALDELAKDLMQEGPMPQAVRSCLSNCHIAIAALGSAGPDVESLPIARPLPLEGDAPAPDLVRVQEELTKLENFVGLLAYLARSGNSQLEEGVFSCLRDSADGIKDALTSALQNHTLSCGASRAQTHRS